MVKALDPWVWHPSLSLLLCHTSNSVGLSTSQRSDLIQFCVICFALFYALLGIETWEGHASFVDLIFPSKFWMLPIISRSLSCRVEESKGQVMFKNGFAFQVRLFLKMPVSVCVCACKSNYALRFTCGHQDSACGASACLAFCLMVCRALSMWCHRGLLECPALLFVFIDRISFYCKCVLASY